MATRRRVQGPHERDPSAGTPSQEDEADIVAEADAVRDEETGELMVDEDRVRELGAVDAESVRENRRLRSVVNKKRANVKHVNFNTGDVLTTYDTILGSWPANAIDIHVRRLTGSPVQDVLTSRPRSGTELYAALKVFHGQYEEAQYAVQFKDNGTHQFRGNGRITMPDTRGPTSQQGQPMNYPYGQPGYQQPPQQQPYMQPAPGYPPAPQHVAPSAPQPPPTVQVMPSSFDPSSMMSMMDQMFQMFRRMQASAQPPTPPPLVPYPPVSAPAQPQQMPPPPSPQASPAEMMAWMQQAFGLFQQTMQAAQPLSTAPQYPPVAPAPVQQPPPPPSPQSGLAETMAMMDQMFQMFQRMQRTQAPPPGAGPGPGPGGPYRGPRPPYYPQGDQGQGGPSGQYAPQPPPQRQPTPAEQLRDAMTVVRTAVNAVQEMNTLLPQQPGGGGVDEAPEDDDSPVRVFEAGPAKIVVDKKDGTLRGWETAWANAGGVMKWVGEQREAIQKASTERQQQQRPRQQLPPGYVEVDANYQPPPGYVAVPVDSQGQDLPPPPAHVPPPISTPAPEQGRRTWGAPTIPEDQGENS